MGAASIPGRSGTTLTRLLLIIAGAMASAWAVATFPVFRSENLISSVARGVRAGDIYKPEILAAAEARIQNDRNLTQRSSGLSNAVLVRLRRTEDAINAGDQDIIDRNLELLSQIIDQSLADAPNDPFLWLVWFWLDNVRTGLRPEHLRFLRASYEFGPYEGWVALKRNRFALAIFSVLPSDLGDQAIAEFVDLVRWGLASEAADIAAGLARPVREILFARLKDVKIDQRRRFAQLWYRRDLDEMVVPGIEPPQQPIRLPVVPPGY
jgi:hypothetical protein